MKTPLFCIIPCAILWCLPAVSHATVIQTPGLISVDGELNGGLIAPGAVGNTMDYLKFQVLTPTRITITSGFGDEARLLLAQFIGRNDEFGFIDNPFYLVQTSRTEWNSFTRMLDPGIYVTVMAVLYHTSYDIFDGFVAVNPEGRGFTRGPYAYSISGDVQALEFWDGNLDGTFVVTSVPEPSTALLLSTTAALLWLRRPTHRKANRVRLAEPRPPLLP